MADAVEEYRVERVPWDGQRHGAEHLADALNGFAADGWSVVSVIPTKAGASAKSLVLSSGTADTTELSYRITPPARTVGPNLARLGALKATNTCGSGAAGDSTSLAARCTSAYEVPPRDSGP